MMISTGFVALLFMFCMLTAFFFGVAVAAMVTQKTNAKIKMAFIELVKKVAGYE